MKEIKFRTICKGEKIIRDVTAIDFLHMKVGVDISGSREWRFYKTLMQFTGLKDKNDKEIYEGDILFGAMDGNGDTHTYQVKYHPEDEWTWNFPTGLTNQIKVIGNIYENSELLK